MKRQIDARSAAAAVAIVLVTAGIAGATNAASASSGTQGIKPRLTDEHGAWYSQDQIASVWQELRSDWPSDFPKGSGFPEEVPAFFTSKDDAATLFQHDLPGLIDARIWRCEWIADAINDGATTPGDRLKDYGSLPGVARNVDVAAYDQQIAAYAERTGANPLNAEYGLECVDLTGQIER